MCPVSCSLAGTSSIIRLESQNTLSRTLLERARLSGLETDAHFLCTKCTLLLDAKDARFLTLGA